MKMRFFIIVLWTFLFNVQDIYGQETGIEISGGERLPENVYITEEGDTLWDICELFFENPWYWPVLWSFNPHITNPHWIFPGSVVYLTPPIEKVIPEKPLALTMSRYSAGPQREEIVSRRVGFISEEDYKGSGFIKGSREEKIYLGENDEAYVQFETPKKVKIGDYFLVYVVEKEIFHPITEKKLGYKVRYLGSVKVIDTEKKLNKVIIVNSYQEIERGNRVAPYFLSQRMVPPVKNKVALMSVIVDTFIETGYFGEYHYVIVDKGKKDGIDAGNRLIIQQKGDGIAEFNPRGEEKMKEYPTENVGEVLIVEPYETTSLGIVSYSIKELRIGETCMMIQGY